jgi:hypothetical protein
MLMGVIPKYQGLGIESAFILKLREAIKHKPHYKEVEFSWVSVFNPKIRRIFVSAGSTSIHSPPAPLLTSTSMVLNPAPRVDRISPSDVLRVAISAIGVIVSFSMPGR